MKCVFTGKEAISHTEKWAFKNGYLQNGLDDLRQFYNNDNILAGNDSYWTLIENPEDNMNDWRLISVKR